MIRLSLSQVQALALLLAVWERPAALSVHARELRMLPRFWACLRQLIEATPAGGDG